MKLNFLQLPPSLFDTERLKQIQDLSELSLRLIKITNDDYCHRFRKISEGEAYSQATPNTEYIMQQLRIEIERIINGGGWQ